MTDPITSPDNEKLKLVRKLADARGRSKHGLFVTEGEDLLAAGLAAEHTPEFVLVAAGSGIGGIEVERALLDRVSALGSGSRAIAVWPLPLASDVATEPDVCVFLDGVSDPANVGAIIRTAAALGDIRVVLGPDCADPFSPKATRASMGALFMRTPMRASAADLPAPRLALEADADLDLDEAIAGRRPKTICLGGERNGLSAETLAECGQRARIRIQPPSVAGVDSLNVAATAAIALHRVCSAAASPDVGGGD